MFYTRKGKLDGALVKEEDIFLESVWLLDLLWAKPDITQPQVDLLWNKLFNDCREWQADMSDHDKRMVAGTVFQIVRASLAQHYDSHYCETICHMLNCTLERELKGWDVEEQKVFLQRLVEQSPALSEWINNYEEADNWLYDEIMAKAIAVKAAFVDAKTIDRVNIYQATINGMYESIFGLEQEANAVLIDAVKLENLNVPSLSIIKGDAKSASIAAASIIAKVNRDRLMDQYDKAEHIAALRQYGPCPIHRQSFEPIRSMVDIEMNVPF